MHEIRNDGPDVVKSVSEGEATTRLREALADPGVVSLNFHKPGSEFTIQNGPFKGRRYHVNALGQPVLLKDA